MLPELFRIGPLPITPYGILVAAGFFLGLWIASRFASRREGADPRQVWDFGVTLVLFSLLGAKLMLIFTDPFFRDPGHLLSLDFIRSAGVFYGGFIAAILWSIYYFRKYRIPGWNWADAFAPGIAAGHVLGRIGCWTAGCCHGHATGMFWGITFHDPLCSVEPALLNMPLVPTQLIEAACNLAIFAFLAWRYGKKRFPGQIILEYVLIYAIARFAVEFGRGDQRGWIWENQVSTSQFIAILAFLAALVYYVKRSRKPVKGRQQRV